MFGVARKTELHFLRERIAEVKREIEIKKAKAKEKDAVIYARSELDKLEDTLKDL